MIPILTPQQMKSADEFAIRQMGILSLQLMENAGKRVVDVLRSRIKNLSKKSAVILCGKGNNGGDGFVVARLLGELGTTVTVVLMEPGGELSPDAKSNLERLNHSIIQSFDRLKSRIGFKADIIIDAMFGTSFKGELTGKNLGAVRWCNEQKGFKIAIDIPSGLNGETGEVVSESFRADLTVTFSNPKIGFYHHNAKDLTGEVVVTDIGLPSDAVEKNSENIFLVERSDIQTILPKRRSNSHKHTVGKVFILAGSKGMTGAALLVSQSAMRSGAGQVILGIPESEYTVVAKRTLEVMPFPLASTHEGSISLAATNEIEKKNEWASIVVVGCGMSQNPETQELIRQIILETEKPLIIDADGLNALAKEISILKKRRSKNVILTPHFGEFFRLTGMSSIEIETNKFDEASTFAKENKVTLVLKGAPTIVATSTGNIFVNPTGNPGMSTAGSGDVLAGLIASLYGQGLSAESAAVTGVYIHGAAGDIAASKKGEMGMIASNIIRFLPTTIQRLQ
ncbi:MAG: NAD(P)H-hydrate dehydratase [Ignavibacteriales bacterium]|nr:NAD(P)H-hydrate dehydratase [Ignavibacteriales bacterium]